MSQCPTLSQLTTPQSDKTEWPWTAESRRLPDRMPDASPWPKFSIITPSYNQGQYLEKTIRSVLLQGYPNLEYIIIDGGSTDESVKTIKKYEHWLQYWVSEPDRGQAHAINKGFEHASGEIFSWLNSDDFYLPDVLGYVAQKFKQCPDEVGALVGMGDIINEKNEVVFTPRVPELNYEALLDWMRYGNFMQPSCFFSRIAWEKCGPLREDLTYPLDVDLWLKMIQHFKFEKLDQVLSHSLSHQTTKTNTEKERMRAETILLIMQHGGEKVARSELMKMADELAEAKRKLGKIKNNMLHRITKSVFR